MSSRSDRGETLIEVLVTVVIMSIAIVAIAGALLTGVRIADVHRKTATATTVLRAYAEALQARVVGTAGTYQDCAGPGHYQIDFTAPDGFDAVPTGVAYWSPTDSRFTATCTTDTGVQRVTLQVTSDDPRISETLDVVIRRP